VTDRTFTGQTQDAVAGLSFFKARYYDTGLGRFVQPDTIVPDWTNPQALNRYAYGLNNPLRFNDPTGHDSWETDPDFHAADPAAAPTPFGFVEANTNLGMPDSGRPAAGSVRFIEANTDLGIRPGPIVSGGRVPDAGPLNNWVGAALGGPDGEPTIDGLIIHQNVQGRGRTVVDFLGGGQSDYAATFGNHVLANGTLVQGSAHYRHELGHAWQGDELGSDYILTYVADLVLTGAINPGAVLEGLTSKDWTRLHDLHPMERDANAFADRWGRLGGYP
jgi:RHS repeat-associated protein